MQEILDFLYSDSDFDETIKPDEGLVEWKKKKSEARARMVTMQNQPYELKVRRSERRAFEFMEERPHRFDKLRERNIKEWEFYMYRCCTDNDTGEKYGWGRVLDYIGVSWEDIPAVQMSFDDIPGVRL